MPRCAVKGCHIKSKNLFNSPNVQEDLEEWQEILDIDDDEFKICEEHFEEKDIKAEKSLMYGAVPTLMLADVSQTERCECCEKPFKKSKARTSEPKYPIDEEFQKLFKELVDCEINLGAVCVRCFELVKRFDKFRRQIKGIQHLRRLAAEMAKAKEMPTESQALQNLFRDKSSSQAVALQQLFEVETGSELPHVQVKDEPMDVDLEPEVQIKEEPVDVKQEPIDTSEQIVTRSNQKFVIKQVPKAYILGRPKPPRKKTKTLGIDNLNDDTPLDPDIAKFQCRHCPLAFAELAKITKHLKEKHIFVCVICKAKFPLKEELFMHHIDEHGTTTGSASGTTQAYKFVCPICKVKFLTEELREDHMTTKHKVKLVVKKVDKVQPKDRIKLPPLPPHLRKLQSLSAPLTSKTIHVKSPQSTSVTYTITPLTPCFDCGLQFTAKEMLQHQLDEHQQKKNFTCDFCGLKLSDQEKIVEHMAFELKRGNV